MKTARIDFMNVLAIFITVVVMVFVMLVNSGCAQKTVVITKYKYIEKKCPKLKTFDSCEQNLTLTAYNKNNQICIREWNGCIDKKSFIDLAKYINKIKTTCKKYESEVKLYNQKIAKPEPSKQ